MKIVEKPWGREEWLEVNDKYVVKKLHINAGHSCSLQYHNFKLESFYMLSGLAQLIHGETEDSLVSEEIQPGFFMTMKPGYIHKMTGITDIVYLETSTIELDDVVRLKDNYQRV